MATGLSPKAQVAQSMLLLHGKDHVETLYVMSAASAAVADVFANNPDPSEDEINAATESAIQNLGYATDLDNLGKQSDYLRQSHAGFWSGSYTIVDSNGAVHALLINATNVRLLLNGADAVLNTPSEGGAFARGKLVADNEKVSVDLSFSTPADGVDLTAESTDVEDLARRFQVMLTGTLTVKADGKGPRNIRGKRGVSTPAGVFHELGEEPAWIWAGEYQLRYTDNERWEEHDDLLVISYDTVRQALSVRLGARQATGVFYRNSALCFRLELSTGVPTQVTMQMQTTSSGTRKCYLWFETTGQMRTLTGYAVRRLADDELWRDPRSLGFRPAVPAPESGAGGAVRAAAATAVHALGAVTSADFCTTPSDVCYSANWLASGTAGAGLVGASGLLAAPGFIVEEKDASGRPTGRQAIFTYSTPVTDVLFFPDGTASVKFFQLHGTDNKPQAGLEYCRIGIHVDRPMEVGALADRFDVRFSLTDYATIDSTGLNIALALDDAAHSEFSLVGRTTSATCEYEVNPRKGPTPGIAELVPDFTKASVLLHGKFGSSDAPAKNYVLTVGPKSPASRISVKRQIQKKVGSAWIDEGLPVTLDLPILVPIVVKKRVGPDIVKFCQTPYDSMFSVADLVTTTAATGRNAASALFAGDTIKIPGSTAGTTVDVSGYRVDEAGADGNPTGRVAMYTAAQVSFYFPTAFKLKPYQELDEAGLPQVGLKHNAVGVLTDQPFELPSMVETDFYEVRLSLLDYDKISSSGLSIALAIDDARQPGLIALCPPGLGDGICPYDAEGGNGPDVEVMKKIGDYTRASVLVRGTTGETQVVGHKTYYFALSPKARAGFFAATKTVYKPSATSGVFEIDGVPSSVEIPVLLRVPIQMDSRDALEASGDSWEAATRGKTYTARVTAMRGQQPFTWRVMKDDKPAGVNWDHAATAGKDISAAGLVSFGLTGTIGSDQSPGTTYQPIIRVMSDKSCVMKPLCINPQITIAEPDTQGRSTIEITNTVAGALAGLAGVAALLMGFVLWKKDVAREKKKELKDKSIDLNDLSSDNLAKIGQEFGDLAKATREIYKNRDYLKRTEKALKAYADVIPDLISKVDKLTQAIKDARSAREIEKLQQELNDAKDEVERLEKERNEETERKDTTDESNSHESI
jgi:hypothetical protein